MHIYIIHLFKSLTTLISNKILILIICFFITKIKKIVSVNCNSFYTLYIN